MLIEQIVKFESKGLGPLKFKFHNTFTRICTPKTVFFLWRKQKSLRKIFELIVIYSWNIAEDNVP